MMMKLCPQTQQEFSPIRTNQVYVNSKARITFNNEKARAKRMITRNVDYAINSNWTILLKQLGSKGRAERSKEYLLGAGFNFNYYQRAYKTNEGVIQVIYNCGFIVNKENDKITIIKL
jgi:hypothetical protein